MSNPTARVKLLLIDDDPSIVEALAARLFRYFEVQGVTDPTQALSAACTFRPDVILCDINMPGIKLSQDRATSRIPLLYLSASMPDGTITELGGSFGGLTGVSKAASIDQLLEAIRSVMP